MVVVVDDKNLKRKTLNMNYYRLQNEHKIRLYTLRPIIHIIKCDTNIYYKSIFIAFLLKCIIFIKVDFSYLFESALQQMEIHFIDLKHTFFVLFKVFL